MNLTLGTRGSQLALWQAQFVAGRLRAHGHAVSIIPIRTRGDAILDKPLSEIGEKGLFTQELDDALRRGRIDLAVHSLKDLPSDPSPGITIAAIPRREVPYDALVVRSDIPASALEDLPSGARIGTSSLRRKAQILAHRPDLHPVPIRGNVDTRLRKLADGVCEALILAEAGLRRLDLSAHITARLEPGVMLPAAGQGALAVVTAEDRPEVITLLREILHDTITAQEVTAERTFLRHLEGGCQVPIGALARHRGDSLHLEGMVASLDGQILYRDAISGTPTEAEALGHRLAEHLLMQGANRLLQIIREQTR